MLIFSFPKPSFMKVNVRHLLSQGMLLVLMVAMSSFAFAQSTVKGKVTDAKSGEGLVAVNVSVKGTDVGAITNVDGDYSVNVPAGATTLVFSYTGYSTKEVEINGQSTINVQMSEGVDLDELVVVGYGAVKKSDLTGAVTSVKAEDFNQGVLTAPDQLIQGKVAGVQIINNSGQPGGGTTVRIRGNSSIRTGNQPLFVVDGVPLDGRNARPGFGSDLGNHANTNPLNFINPNDIASMEVLKDASAAAIYGARGANGVVIITTKRGRDGAPRVEFNSTVGASSILKRYDVLTGDEYRAALTDYGLSGDGGSNVDAFDAILQNGTTQNYNFAIGGGNDLGNYRISAGYFDQEGIIVGSRMKKYTANLTGTFKFFDERLSVDYNLLAAQTDENIAPITTSAGFTGNLVGQALQWNPTVPLTTSGGEFTNSTNNPLVGNTTINPSAMIAGYTDVANGTNILGSISPSFKLTDNLTYRFLYSINHAVGTRQGEIASWLNVQNVENRGLASIAGESLTTNQYTHTVNYTDDIANNVSLNAVLGYEYQSFNKRGYSMTGQDFLSNAVPYVNQMQSTSTGSRVMSSFADPSTELQSYFGRTIFNISDKYLITATVRVDGSSKFGANNKYGVFPSFAAAWNLHNEGFLPESVNSLKLRASWGQTGNQEFPAGASQARYGFGQGTLALENVANPDLRWETTTSFNVGVDFAILDYKLTGSIDYFNNNTTNLLFNFATIQPAPASRYWTNLDGNVLNSGLELALEAYLIQNDNMEWTLGGNVAFLTNELQNYTGPTVITGTLFGQGSSGAFSQRLENGQPLNAFYLRDFTSINDNGQSEYVDDGNTMFYLGDPNPDVLVGLSTNFTAGDLSVGLNFNGALGHQIYNNTAMSVTPIGNLGSRNIDASLVQGVSVQESVANPITSSDRYLEDADYLKLANMTIGYNIGDIQGIKNVRISLTGQNLLVFTNFSGFDPEVNTVNDRDGVPSFGIEYIPFPSARTILFGLNFSF
jgi:iron complex outermembrane receptor protein